MLSGANPDAKDNDNWTPLHTAIRRGQEWGVKTIVELNDIVKKRGLEQFDLNATGGVHH